jgi:uncharacterized protein (DUF885 family)
MKNLLCLLLGLLLLQSCAPKEKVSHLDTQKALAEFVSSLKDGGNRLPGSAEDEMSATFFDARLQQTMDQLQQLTTIDSGKLVGDDLIDWRFAHSILVGKQLERERRLWQKDPRVYLTFTRLSPILGRPGSDTAKVKELTRKLLNCARQMDNGRQQLTLFVPRFQELGLFMAENGFAFFDGELTTYINRAQAPTDSLRIAAATARQALEKYVAFVKTELLNKEKGDFPIGKDAYNRMLAGQILLGFDADSLYNFGWYHFRKTVAEMDSVAKRIDPSKTWKQVALDVKNEYPEPHQMIPVHQEWVNKTRDHVIKHNLIPIPWKERVKVVERAPYLRKTSYYGHFSFARAKDPDSIFTSEMHINPFEDQWDDKKKQEYLNEHDWGVIMVTAPHETYAGHHIQGLYQIHNPRALRRENSISIFHEGWGLYNEQLFRETGFFPNDKIILRQLQLRLWRIARVIYDVGLHTGKMNYDEAIRLMTDEVGFLYWAAQLEVDAATTSPGYFIGYFTGMIQILQIRDDYRQWKGEQFTLSDFHEQLLSVGSMPIPLMRQALFASRPQ